MTLAEVVALCATAFLALTAVFAYVIDSAGLGVQAWPVALALIVIGAAMQRRSSRSEPGDLIAWLVTVIFLFATFLRMSWPSLVPPGRGPDLTHHLLLVDYIQQHGHLVHDRTLDGSMGEMAHYTPAAHVLAVIIGGLFRVDGLRAFFPLAAACAALAAGFVFLIARRVGLSLPYSIAAVVLLFLPAQYFFGAFTHDGFLAQTVSTLFAVAMWWAIAWWDDQPAVASVAIIAILLVATFLSWPIWIGPPLLVFVALLLRAELPLRERVLHLAIVIVPLLTIFLLHSWDRWGWMVIVRTSGAVLHPSFASLGWLLPLLAVIGAGIAAGDRRARVTIVLLMVIVLQAVTLFAIAKTQGADTPYMAYKMFYLAIYPLAILGAYALSRVSVGSAAHDGIGWLIAAVLVVVSVRPALTAPRPIPVVDLDLSAAGQWLRANGGAACSDYLVGDAETAYWLHLAVLGNPRSAERMRELDRYEPNAAIAPWITANGRRYAIADLRLLPDEVLRADQAEIRAERVRVIARFGNGAVISRRDATIMGCD